MRDALPQLWSRQGSWWKYTEDLADLTGSNTTVVATQSNCAPGTTKGPMPLALQRVLCSWHCKSSVPFAPQKCSCICAHCLSKVLLHRCWNQPMSGVCNHLSHEVCGPPQDGVVGNLVYLWKFFCSHDSPGNGMDHTYHSSWCPKMVSGQSPPLTH